MNQSRKISVYVVVPPRLLLLDVAGPVEVLRKANLEQSAVEFLVHYVGPQVTVETSIGLSVTGIAPLPDQLADDAMVVVSGSADIPLGGAKSDRELDSDFEKQIVEWLHRVVRPGVRLVTICSGAILAARAGLFDGIKCTTHHLTMPELERRAPTAQIMHNRLFVEDGERLSSTGVTAGIDLMLHIVANLTSHQIALEVARYLVVYLRRSGNDPQLSPWLEGRNHMHPAVHRAQDMIVENPTANWSVDELARISGASPRNLSRLFNEHTGMSVTDYTNRLKVALAQQILLHSDLDIESVAERAGFASARQFRRVWQRVYNAPPSHMRQSELIVRPQ